MNDLSDQRFTTCARCGEAKPPSAFFSPRACNCLVCAGEVYAEERRRKVRERAAKRAAALASGAITLPAEKACTKCGEVKALPAFRKNMELRDGRDSWCRVCVTAGTKEWRKTPEGREKVLAAKRRHRANRSPEQALRDRQRLDAASARVAERKRQATAHSKALALAQRLDVLLFDHRAHVDEWRRQPKERRRPQKRPWWDVDDADLASDPRPNRVKKLRRIRTIKRATPPWADKREIAAAYRAAQLLTEQTGNLWHVDHVIPLRHPLVCGLHCEANLQLLPSVYNEAKGNQWSPDHA